MCIRDRNFRGFERIVDTLGGVTVDVENPIRDNEYPTEDYGTMSIYIPTGVQHMNGKVALQYARSRHSENDFGRAKRQQNLLVAIKDKALALDVIPKIPSLMGTMKDMIDTDIPPTDILRLAGLAKGINSTRVSSLVIDEKLAIPFRGEGGQTYWLPTYLRSERRSRRCWPIRLSRTKRRISSYRMARPDRAWPPRPATF